MGLDIVIFNDTPVEADREYETTDISFGIDEWTSFFFDELKVPMPLDSDRGDWAEYHRKADEMFRQALSVFPMLSRINDYYSDAKYNSQEIYQLLDECNRILPSLTKVDAISFAKGLVSGCKIAIESRSGLFLGAD